MKSPDLQPLENVDLSLIDPPVFNSRLGFDINTPDGKPDAELTGLAKSMESDGLKQPVGLERMPTGRYTLLWGSRRYRAARINDWTAIPARVYTDLTELDRIIFNGIENLQRKDLSTFEQARLFSQLRAGGLDLKQCSAKLGFSAQKISNYTRAYDFLPPTIKTAWQKGEKAATAEFMIELVGPSYRKETEAETQALQLAAWDERQALQKVADDILTGAAEDNDEEDDEDDQGEDAEASSEGNGKASKPKDFKIELAYYKHIVKALKSKKSAAGAGVALQVLDLAVGKIEAVRGLTSRTEFEKAKASKDVKAAEKELASKKAS